MGVSIDRSTFAEEEYDQAGARLRDNLAALKHLLGQPDFGRGAASLGAELELCIVDQNARALPLNREILADSMDPHLQFELDRFNLEYNLSPVAAAGAPFSAMRTELENALTSLERVASTHGGRMIAIGILPTLTMHDLQESAMTDMHRYHALSNAIGKTRRDEFRIHIEGDETVDEACEQITMEGANTSFQVHMRVDPDDFSATYNAAQLVTPLALAVGSNSPFFLGRSLWQETRIALFKQTMDTRGPSGHEWRRSARVPFGHGWARRGAYELFAESCLLYPILIPLCSDDDPLEVIGRGEIPNLDEMRLQQSTIWNWNRPVYDSAEGGHLRIEFRSLPAGPTPVDMMANAAFITGLTIGFRDRVEELLPAFPFRHAEYNFYRAAQHGLDASLLWPDLDMTSPRHASALDLCQEFLPVASEGLAMLGVSSEERQAQLAIIERRLQKQVTAARWQQKNVQKQGNKERSAALGAMVEEYLRHSKSGTPVADWQ